ncbi:AraC family transcriptional regulator [Paenibacillus thermoaerophilus]|uniref:AraC family transcriptional regulator n=1 Tax=Paenibacillus thermoaerophilus TaxID=1215385 RepID=A0ABW2V6F9_9BACL|nr:AraC family transcriptional regulator [Paenibacillus thermoaerophilus]TMV17691.1 AraC family transcriptional regulator [Paenibacillus thermoaerophilus]
MWRPIPWFRNTTFKRKLFVYSLVISLLPVVVTGTILARMAAAAVQEEVNKNHQVILQEMQRQVDSFWAELDKASFQLANHRALEQAVQLGPSDKYLDEMLELVDTIQKQRSISEFQYDVSVIFVNFGKVYSSRYGFIDLNDFAYRDIIDRIPPHFRSEIIPPDTYPGQSELLSLRPVPIFSDKQGSGILVIHIQKDKLAEFARHVDLGGNRRLYVFDEQGVVLISRTPEEIGTRPALFAGGVPRYYSGEPAEIDIGGETYRVTLRQSDYTRWSYVAMTPKKELTRQADRMQATTFGIMALLAAFWALIARFGSKRLYGPVQRLLQQLRPPAREDSPAAFQNEWHALDAYVAGMLQTNQQLRRQLNEQSPYLKETIVHQLLRGEINSNEAKRVRQNFGFQLRGSRFVVCLVDIDDYAHFQQLYKDKDLSLMMFALRKMVEEIFEEWYSCAAGISMPGQIALIVGLEKGDAALDHLLSTAQSFLDASSKYFQFTVSMACARPVLTYRDISEGYREARDLLGYRLLYGPGKLLTPQQVLSQEKQIAGELVKREKHIVSTVMQGKADEAAALLREWVRDMPPSVRHFNAALGLFAHLIGELVLYMQELELPPHEVFGEDPYKRLYKMTTIHEVTEWLAGTVFPSIGERLELAQTGKQQRLAGEVIRYIHNHFDTDLSLQQIADQLRVSPSHLSRVFKEETGVNFIDYLIRYRMDKAKEWLAHTEMPIKEIAERLRYTSVQNFARVFKQCVQLPPGEYRKRFRGE